MFQMIFHRKDCRHSSAWTFLLIFFWRFKFALWTDLPTAQCSSVNKKIMVHWEDCWKLVIALPRCLAVHERSCTMYIVHALVTCFSVHLVFCTTHTRLLRHKRRPQITPSWSEIKALRCQAHNRNRNKNFYLNFFLKTLQKLSLKISLKSKKVCSPDDLLEREHARSLSPHRKARIHAWLFAC